jgi:FMN phosphatase YigB (HAD superfamily)
MTISQFTVKIKAVFFDLDGVLVDTYKVWFLQHFSGRRKSVAFSPL